MMPEKNTAREKLLDAAISQFRANGYCGTSVEDLCATAGVTKGAFFHHFASKEDLAIAGARYWSDITGQLFATAPYHLPDKPLDRILAYIDFRKDILQGDIADFTCYAGTLVQEVYNSVPDVAAACGHAITAHAETLEDDIRRAKKDAGIRSRWSARSLALHIQAVLQGAFILTKATGEKELAEQSIDHLRRYVVCLYSPHKS